MKEKKFGEVSWTVDDILTIKNEWTVEQAEDFLTKYENRLIEDMVSRGWDSIAYYLEA